MFYSFLSKGTLITLADETTKPVEELVEDDEVLTYNYSAKNHDWAHSENNELRFFAYVTFGAGISPSVEAR